MRHINEWPSFTHPEMDDLRRKIITGVVTEDFQAPHPAHVARAALEGKNWVNFPCWLGATKWGDGKGFMKMKFKGHTLYIHRASYECFNGPVPDGKLVDHLCRVRGCRQPMHLEAISAKENILRGASQNALLRGDAPSPITAREINPEFFKPVDVVAIDDEHRRRVKADRDVKRMWDISQDPVLPPPPAGFWWVQGTHEFNKTMFYLNPIRPEEDNLPHYAKRSLEYNRKFAQEAFAEAVTAYAPRAQVAGVDYPDTTNDAPMAKEQPVDFNPAWLAGDHTAKMLLRQPITAPALVFGTPVHAESDSFDKYHGLGEAIALSPTPVEPDPHDDPFYLKMPQPVVVKGSSSLAAFFEYIGLFFLCFMPERVRLWFLR